MKLLIRMALLLSAIGLASPVSSATLSYHFKAVGGPNNSEGQVIGQLSIDTDGAPIFQNGKSWIHHAKAARLELSVTGGAQDGTVLTVTNVPIFGMYSTLVNAFYAGNSRAGLMMHRWNAPFMAAENLDVLSFTSGLVWVRPDLPGASRTHSYVLSDVSAAQFATVPLPATFPILMGACLATAFFGRRRRKT